MTDQPPPRRRPERMHRGVYEAYNWGQTTVSLEVIRRVARWEFGMGKTRFGQEILATCSTGPTVWKQKNYDEK